VKKIRVKKLSPLVGREIPKTDVTFMMERKGEFTILDVMSSGQSDLSAKLISILKHMDVDAVYEVDLVKMQRLVKGPEGTAGYLKTQPVVYRKSER
jgi:hypothetical protein